MGNSFSEKSVRRAFIKKVYGILTAQLLLTFAIVAVIFFVQPVKHFIFANPAILYAAMAGTFVLMIVLVCCTSVGRKFPLNVILLAIFTVLEGVVVGSICAVYDTDAVVKAVVTTVVIVAALTLFAFQTKIDFTAFTGVLFCLSIALLVLGIMCAIFRNDILQTVYAVLGAFIFSAYIVVDTQLLMGGNHKVSISPEDYVFAALNLYVDIINLFLMILSLFGDRS